VKIQFTDELVSSAGSEPPTEFRLLKMGVNETTKGPINVTRESIDAVLAQIKADGRDQNRLSFDFNHAQMRAQTAEEGISAGWFSVEGREDGLWIVNAEWTERASTALAAREYRFFSPVLMLDAKTREPTQLVNVALTNLPATKDQTPLVASQNVDELVADQPKESLVDEKAVLQLFGALGVSDVAGASEKFDALSKENDALKSGAAEMNVELSALKADVAKREQAEAVAKRDALIAELTQAGKLAPAMGDWAKTQTIEQLAAFGAVAPVALSADETVAPIVGDSHPLSPEEKAVCVQMNMSEADYIEARKEGL
jgi:phage I-like protein